MSGGIEDMEVDYGKVGVQLKVGYMYKVTFHWFKNADVLAAEDGLPTGLLVHAKELCPAIFAHDFVKEWYSELDPSERTQFRRANAQDFWSRSCV